MAGQVSKNKVNRKSAASRIAMMMGSGLYLLAWTLTSAMAQLTVLSPQEMEPGSAPVKKIDESWESQVSDQETTSDSSIGWLGDWSPRTFQQRSDEIFRRLEIALGSEQAKTTFSSLKQGWQLSEELVPSEMDGKPLRWQQQQLADALSRHWQNDDLVRQRWQESLDRLETISGNNDNDWISSEVRLAWAGQLARQQRYDLAILLVEEISLQDVVFPEVLMMVRGTSAFKLLRYESAERDLRHLLRHKEQLERRTATLTGLMLAEMEGRDEESLQEVAKVMDDALRRQQLNESGKRVLDQEQRVIDLLDQLITKKEEQQKQQQQQQQSSAAPSPGRPMDRSMRAPLLGQGETDPRKLTAKEWGDLPPAQQAKVIAEMTRQMPPHYRKVIEEYFRQLSESNPDRR